MSQHFVLVKNVLINIIFEILIRTDPPTIFSRLSLNNYEISYIHLALIVLLVMIEKYMAYIMRLLYYVQ